VRIVEIAEFPSVAHSFTKYGFLPEVLKVKMNYSDLKYESIQRKKLFLPFLLFVSSLLCSIFNYRVVLDVHFSLF